MSFLDRATGALVFLLLTYHIPFPVQPRISLAKQQLTQFLPLHDAEKAPLVPLWRTVVLASVGLMEALVWVARGSFLLISNAAFRDAASHFCVASAWLYTAGRPVFRPTATVPFDILTLYLALVLAGGVQLVERVSDGSAIPLVASVLNLAVLAIVLAVVLGMPLAMAPIREQGTRISLEHYTSLGRWLTFSWVYPLIRKGRKEELVEDDVWELSPTFRSRPLFEKFSSLPGVSLLRRLWLANSLDMILTFVLALLSVIFNFTGPFFLRRILDILDTEYDPTTALNYAVLMFIGSIAKSQCDVQHLWYGRRAGTRIRSELMAAIYDKALKRIDLSGDTTKIDNPSKSGADMGKIINLFSGDASRISSQVLNLHHLYGAPLAVLIGSIMLYDLLGFPAFSGFLVILLASPINSAFTRRNERIQKAMNAARDARMRVITELVGAIKLVKLFAWEDRWIGKVFSAREVELGWLIKARIHGIGFLGLWVLTPILISAVSFCTYVLLGNQLTIGKAFTAIALFGMIREPLRVIPSFIVQILQTRLSVERIEAFLNEPEVGKQFSMLKRDRFGPPTQPETRLGFENASFKWNGGSILEDSNVVGMSPASTSPNNRQFELTELSVVFPEGKLTLVTGPTASGKTALLMALLGEMKTINGRVLLTKDATGVDEWGNMYAVSYAAQSPWLRHQSIRDNILFGSTFDEARYNQVVECCALGPDLELLEDGDATEIGEKGVSLSGGQKARVALARAVYARTKYVLLDDPLSAVDSHTARALYDKCLCGRLLANRTVVLVTHHVRLVLPVADYLVRMVDGRVEVQGSVAELKARSVLEDIVQEARKEEEAPKARNVDKMERKPRKLVEDEHREVGGVKWRVYHTYLQAMSIGIWTFMLFGVVLLQILAVGEKLWIRIWADAYKGNAVLMRIDHIPSSEVPMVSVRSMESGWPNVLERPLYYVAIYAAIGVATALVTVVCSSAQMTGAYRAGQFFFRALVNAVVRAPFRFHDTTPQGRLLSRFGKDMENIDLSVATALGRVNSYLAGFIASRRVPGIRLPLRPSLYALDQPNSNISAVVIGYCYYTLAVAYLNTGRDLRRMESNSRSPIFSDLAEVLHGIVTIRAFTGEKRFLENMHAQIDRTTKLWYMFWMTNQWLLLNYDFLGSLAVLLTTLFSVAYLRDDAGLAGLAITSALNFTTNVYWTCYYWTELELDLNSVERVIEYLGLPQEPPAVIESNRPPAYWPSSSSAYMVVVENLSIKYAPQLPCVIQDVSFALRAGERVGLLGRTGSGKSTLAMSLLRFTDPSSGRILLDGIDITTIGLEDLRSRLTYIPQDATLFSGTLRENLDPFDEHDDATLLSVLERVGMLNAESAVNGEPQTFVTLDIQVSAGGTSFSQGQRQLIAMERPLLRRNSIVIMDEATSSVDEEACPGPVELVLFLPLPLCVVSRAWLISTVAHRLKTIIDYDRLVVLDKGRVVETGTPYELIHREEGVFRGMCLKSGYSTDLESAAASVNIAK
ncbi:ABC bile acid [Mycena kentingensis (nom. inval.)]|nr:ABC bile acid [Mycena kentingensis (nom. inval.)]